MTRVQIVGDAVQTECDRRDRCHAERSRVDDVPAVRIHNSFATAVRITGTSPQHNVLGVRIRATSPLGIELAGDASYITISAPVQ